MKQLLSTLHKKQEKHLFFQIGIIFLFCIFFSHSTLAQISSITDGNWSNTNTWDTGTIPTATDDVVINHTVSIETGDSCHNIHIMESGTLQNQLDASHTLTVEGSVTNYGVIMVSNNNFTLNISGNIQNKGTWQNTTTNLTGQYEQYVWCQHDKKFACQNFVITNPQNIVYLQEQLHFAGTDIDFGGASVNMSDYGAIWLDGGSITNGELFANYSTISLLNGAFCENITITDAGLRDDFRIGAGVVLEGTVESMDTLRNKQFSETLLINGSFYNYGVIEPITNSLYLNINGDIYNNGSWKATSTKFISAYGHTISAGEKGVFSNDFIATDSTGTINAGSHIKFDNASIDLNNKTLALQNNTLGIFGVSGIQNVIISDARLQGTWNVKDNVIFRGYIINEGTLQNIINATASTTIEGTLLNYGTLINTNNYFRIAITGDFMNYGYCRNADTGGTEITLTGNETQNISLTTDYPIECAVFFESKVTGTLFQWEKDGVKIPDETNKILEFNGLDTNDYGSYVYAGALQQSRTFNVYEGQSDNMFGGIISEDTQWCGEIRITDDITLEPDVKLSICPGSTVIMQGLYSFNIQGKMIATGEESAPVMFLAQNPDIGWGGISFNSNNNQDSSKFNYVIIKDVVPLVDNADGSALYFNQSPNFSVTNSKIYTNQVIGIHADNQSTGKIVHCRIYGNAKDGIRLTNQTAVDVSGCLIYNNSASGIYVYDSTDDNIINCTITGNGTGVHCSFIGEPTIMNTIIWGNSPTQIGISESAPQVSYCLVEGGYEGTGNIDGNPVFSNPPTNDFTIGSGSPCVNAGNPDMSAFFVPQVDLKSEPRINQNIIDIGAFEYQSALGGIIYVNKNATGTGNGISWENAYTNLQKALSVAEAGNQIWVAAGTYYPDEGDGQTDNDRSASFVINSDVEVFGGFAGYEYDIDERDIATNQTILSGDIDNSPDDNSQNSYHVVWFEQASKQTTLDGFTITGGNADYSSLPDNSGGGIYVNGDMGSCNPIIRNCNIVFNSAAHVGGGIMNNGDDGFANPTLINCRISNNSANDAGGIYNDCDNGVSNPTLINCLVANNQASGKGGGMLNDGNKGTSSPVVANCTFTGNTAVTKGGAISNEVQNGGACAPQYINTIVYGNSTTGSQIYNLGEVEASYKNCDIEGSGGSINWNPALGSDLGNNIDLPPMFVNYDNQDFHLSGTSPCIDAGSPLMLSSNIPEYDLDGNPRVVNQTIDIGAFEYQGTTPQGSTNYITENTTWCGDTIIISSNVMIEENAVLTICPGTNVLFNGDFQIKVSGAIHAVGLEDNRIVFSTTNQNPSWAGIVYDYTNEALASHFKYCSFYNAESSESYPDGGAFTIYNYDNLLIEHCYFTENHAYNSGGAIYLNNSNIKINSCLFDTNTAQSYAGALYCSYCPAPKIVRNMFTKNMSTEAGAIKFTGSNPVFVNNAVINNIAQYAAGGVYYYQSNGVANNNTFANNSAEEGNAIYFYESSPVFRNTIIWGDLLPSPPVHLSDDASDPDFYYCDIRGGKTGFSGDGSGILHYTGTYENNIELNPLFENNGYHKFRLQRLSPCINSGTGDTTGMYLTTLDLKGNPRIKYNTIDIGAYEYNESMIKAFFTHSIENDTVFFTDQSEGEISTWFWNFNDGRTSTQPSPKHVYKESGNYNVCLTVKNDEFNSFDTYCKKITVGDINCQAAFSVTVDETQTNTVKLLNMSTTVNNDAAYLWSFGNYETSPNPDIGTYTYQRGGVYRICLAVYDSLANCFDKTCETVEVGEVSCNADFDFIIDSENHVVFSDKSTHAQQYYWSFGDGTYDTIPNPEHTYTQGGVYFATLLIYNPDNQCSSIKSATIRLNENTDTIPCQSEFSYYLNPVTNKVAFADQSTGTITNWYWTFGDGKFSKKRNPVHFYEAGDYNVCLIVTDTISGNTSKSCQRIDINEQGCNLDAAFSYFINPKDTMVILADQSKGDVHKRFWRLGDGNTATKKRLIHKYDKPGLYKVALAVFDTITPCFDWQMEEIQVGEVGCRALFAYQVVTDSNFVHFRDKSQGNIVRYFWKFGDGKFSIKKNPKHRYKEAGMYNVSLTISNLDGTCIDHYRENVQVGEVECSAAFTAFVDSTTNNVRFKNAAVGKFTRLLWEFGDGRVSNRTNPVHHYSQPGYYTASLNIYNPATGCMDNYEETILVGSEGVDCEADFVYQQVNNTTLKFFDRSAGDDLTYLWNFGDGSTSENQNPEHDFTEPDVYNVCLNIYQPNGISNTTCKEILVSDENQTEGNCAADFIYTIDSTSLSVVCQDMSIGEPDTWEWRIGSQDVISTDPNPEYTFNEAGYYLVRLKIKNSTTGCEDVSYDLLNVAGEGDGFRVSFGYDIDTADFKGVYPTDFIGATAGNPKRNSWDFDDGEVDTTTTSPTHVYTETGTYNVCYTVTDPVTHQEDVYCEDVVIEATGIEDFENQTANIKLNVYPNPCNDFTFVSYQISKTSDVEIGIFDVAGNKIATKQTNRQSKGAYRIKWFVGGLSSGVYVIKLKTKQGEIQQKLIITK